MTDIVERLRELAETERPFARGYIIEAADEIERLREELRVAKWELGSAEHALGVRR